MNSSSAWLKLAALSLGGIMVGYLFLGILGATTPAFAQNQYSNYPHQWAQGMPANMPGMNMQGSMQMQMPMNTQGNMQMPMNMQGNMQMPMNNMQGGMQMPGMNMQGNMQMPMNNMQQGSMQPNGGMQQSGGGGMGMGMMNGMM